MFVELIRHQEILPSLIPNAWKNASRNLRSSWPPPRDLLDPPGNLYDLRHRGRLLVTLRPGSVLTQTTSRVPRSASTASRSMSRAVSHTTEPLASSTCRMTAALTVVMCPILQI